MAILILKEQEVEFPVVSVTIKPYGIPTELHMFFCPFCQSPLIQYHGAVFMVVEGSIPDMFPIYRRCKRCKRTFAFNMLI